MNKLELISAISVKTGLSFRSARDSLDAILDCITEGLVKRDKIKLIDFGSFEVVARAARKGFNPHTRTEVIIPACNEPMFKPGKELKEIIKNS